MLASTSACKQDNSSCFFKCNFICQYLRCHHGDVSRGNCITSEKYRIEPAKIKPGLKNLKLSDWKLSQRSTQFRAVPVFLQKKKKKTHNITLRQLIHILWSFCREMGPSFRTFKLWMMDDFTAKWGFSRSAANRDGRQASCAASEGNPRASWITDGSGERGRMHPETAGKLSSVDVQVFPNGACVGPQVASKDQCVGEVAPQTAHFWFVSSGLTEDTWQLISTPTENWLAAPLKVWSVEFTETSSVVASQLSIPRHARRNFVSLQSEGLVCLFHSESSGVQWLRDLCRFTASCWVLHHYTQINI